MKIVIATGNSDKLEEIKNIWKDIAYVDIDWIGNYDIGEIEETGNSLFENAVIKAEYVANKTNSAAVADDTGLFVECLNGQPGVHSARFAGKNVTYEDNVRKLLDDMKNVPMEQRKAEFKTIVCFTQPGAGNIFTEGTVKGIITLEKIGQNGFGYDPIFKVDDCGKTYAQMSLEEKNAISHRYLAFKKMADNISKKIRDSK
ncbi:RdgB/HAM1 family non-canonical purine NTP pyrophosphatase [Elusimicrobiota bacterium]